MAEPVTLQLFPSCYSCLAWSADGDLAIAAGEYVHILTPKVASRSADTAQSPENSSPWLPTRIRVNMFTNKEWETTWPQTRDHFSIGAEQSISTVAALSWSPPGLAQHRRCLLGVLTSNLVLSFYESFGPQAKWTRVAIATNALREYFSSHPIAERGLRLRKERIRSFAWCPQLKDPVSREDDASEDPILSPEERWGRHLLAVANDDNDIILLRIKRQRGRLSSTSSYSIQALSHISVDDPIRHFPMITVGSVYAAVMRSKARVSHISCGPWIRQPLGRDEDGSSSLRAIVGVLCGSNLKLIGLDASIASSDHAQQVSLEVSVVNLSVSASDLENVNFTGPLQWIYGEQSPSIILAAGIFAGRAILSLSEEMYTGKDTRDRGLTFRKQLFSDHRDAGADGVVQNDHSRPWEPITSIAVVIDRSGRPDSLHLGTLGAWAEVSPYSTLREDGQGSILQPEWKNQVDHFRERFDIDHDLGGLAVSRTWGLAAFRGWIAAAFTMHPGDMVEYTTAAEERTTVVFSAVAPHANETNRFMDVPDFTEDNIRKQRERILQFILSHAISEEEGLWSKDLRSPRIVYAAAACSIINHRSEELLSLAQKALERLSIISGADLSSDISQCSFSVGSTPTVAAKSVDVLNGAGGAVFERCDICGSGIEWYSAQEAQCAPGHLFGKFHLQEEACLLELIESNSMALVRCGLTFLAIQEPGVSKFCSLCGTEYLDMTDNASSLAGEKEQVSEKDLDPVSLCDKLIEFFDTCPYCGGKFRDA